MVPTIQPQNPIMVNVFVAPQYAAMIEEGIMEPTILPNVLINSALPPCSEASFPHALNFISSGIDCAMK